MHTSMNENYSYVFNIAYTYTQKCYFNLIIKTYAYV